MLNAGLVCFRPMQMLVLSLIFWKVSFSGFINGGSPDVSIDVDCAIRKEAWEFGKKLLPQRKSFKTLYDALQLQACNMTQPFEEDVFVPPKFTIADETYFVVDPVSGFDSNEGSVKRPFKSLKKALEIAHLQSGPVTIALREGTHFTEQLHIKKDDLTIQNFDGERAVVSGGVKLNISSWKPYEVVKKPFYEYFEGQSNAWGLVDDPDRNDDHISFLGKFDDAKSCESTAKGISPFFALSYFDSEYRVLALRKRCFGFKSQFWQPLADSGATSMRLKSRDIYVADVYNDIDEIPGLRVNENRATRARFPNIDPVLSGRWYISDPAQQAMGGGQYWEGWIIRDTKWKPSKPKSEAMDIIITASQWPNVEWPMKEAGGSTWTGEGDWGEFHIGIGGSCDDVHPPVGYWCSTTAPRHITAHGSPSGIYWKDVLPQAVNYSDPTTGILQAWRGCSGRWYTNMWKIESSDPDAGSFDFTDDSGFQGGEGCPDGGSEWFIENIFEELDAPTEYFFDEKAKKLYYYFNDTTLMNADFVATTTRVLFNVSSASMDAPVKNTKIQGLTIQDARYTYLDPHGLPSGGDWALQRSGAVFAQNADGLTIDSNEFTNLDGNAISINGYVRNTAISNNEFSFIGDNAIASWGYTGRFADAENALDLGYKVGPDGRGGEQPRGVQIIGNLARELGINQKQSSFYFHAVSALAVVSGNVHFNGPRAGINFNDGFGGGDDISNNLFANCVRESGDHGPWNSWDRVPYITNIRTGSPSIIPKDRHIHHNFWVGTYSTQADIDNDDGSAYYMTHDNFFAYGQRGQKQDFGGQWNHHYNNLYGYVDYCMDNGNNYLFANNDCIMFNEDGYASDCHLGFNQTCHSNRVYTRSGVAKSCGTTLDEWVQEGHDKGSSQNSWPNTDELSSMIRQKLDY